jgi:hypothetical protein
VTCRRTRIEEREGVRAGLNGRSAAEEAEGSDEGRRRDGRAVDDRGRDIRSPPPGVLDIHLGAEDKAGARGKLIVEAGLRAEEQVCAPAVAAIHTGAVQTENRGRRERHACERRDSRPEGNAGSPGDARRPSEEVATRPTSTDWERQRRRTAAVVSPVIEGHAKVQADVSARPGEHRNADERRGTHRKVGGRGDGRRGDERRSGKQDLLH